MSEIVYGISSSGSTKGLGRIKVPFLRIEYEYGNKIGKKIRHGREWCSPDLIAKYPVGKDVVVYVDPNNEDWAVLEPGFIFRNHLINLYIVVFILIIWVGIFSGFLSKWAQ